ncbi:MAG: hypothetical protein ACLTH3_11125 [Lachnospira sp.]
MVQITGRKGIFQRPIRRGVVSQAPNRCSFSAERRELVAVVGRSGSGKCFLSRIPASFDKPDEGKGLCGKGEEISGG